MKAGLLTTEIKLNFKLAMTKRPPKYIGSRSKFISLSRKIPRFRFMGNLVAWRFIQEPGSFHHVIAFVTLYNDLSFSKRCPSHMYQTSRATLPNRTSCNDGSVLSALP